MEYRSKVTDAYFWVALLIIISTIFLMVAVYSGWFELHFTVDLFIWSYNLHHWFSWIGTLFVALFTPLYIILKGRYVEKIKILLNIHMFGNLLSVLLVSIHFTQQISRPAQFYPDLGTGIALYPTMVLLVLSGFLSRFQIIQRGGKYWRLIHQSMTFTFYMIIIIHILHGLAII